jgi:manganese/zinc/iron transport system substrate-binding protein
MATIAGSLAKAKQIQVTRFEDLLMLFGCSSRTPILPKCFFTFAVAAGILVAAMGCKPSRSMPDSSSAGASKVHSGEHPINAVATVGMVADLVRNVGGQRVSVKQICGSGVDPHLYKATRDDMQTIVSGDIVFYCGLMLEGKMIGTLEKMSEKQPVFAVTEMIDKSTLMKPDGFEGHPDPHVWMDVSAWSKCVGAVEKALAEFAPDRADEFKENAAAYREQLARLHDYGVKSLATVPKNSRLLVTSHDAFNYFGNAYDIEVQGVQGLSTESEAGVQRINELVDTLVDRKVTAVFVESSVSPKNIKALIEGAKSRDHDVIVGGELFSDAMGQTGTYEGTYVGMLDHNITTVTRALGSDVPEDGFGGKSVTDSDDESL